jgi:hypothetical protein
MQVGAQECRHDAGEHHASVAPRIRQDAHSQGAEQWTTGVEVRMMLPSNRRGGKRSRSPVMSREQSRNRNKYALPVNGLLFNIAQFQKRLFSFSS